MLDALTEPGWSAAGARAEAGTTEAETGAASAAAAATDDLEGAEAAGGAAHDAATATKPKTRASARGRIGRIVPAVRPASRGSLVAPTRILPAMAAPPAVAVPSEAVRSAFLEAVRASLPDLRLLTDPVDRESYRRDETAYLSTGLPLAVALPANTAEVSGLVRLAAQHRIPIVPRGAG